MDLEKIKKESETVILQKNGKICAWLPHIEADKTIRSNEELIF